jgi:hypothetical protein
LPPAPLDLVACCKADRSAQMRTAQETRDLQDRTRILTSLPNCAEVASVVARAEARRPCEERRAAIKADADRHPDMGERVRILQSLPDCSLDDARGQRERSGSTGEISAGLGLITFTGRSSLKSVGVSLGAGGFVSPNVALTARIAGTVIVEDGFGFAGFLGPSAQVWLSPQFWLGGGVGLGLIAGCGGGGCGSFKGGGLDARMGYSFAKRGAGGNISLELTKIIDAPISIIGITLGYQGY